MPLRSLRFAGDPTLEKCIAGSHRMFSAEEGLPVLRIQAALLELGFSLGPQGADGIFGNQTGAAVSVFKSQQTPPLVPTDPVVGVGTMTALDNRFFIDPPILDPAFREFSPLVAARRLEPFVANELARLVSAPFDSWRHMAAMHALNGLNSGALAGIVAASRFGDLRNHVLQHAKSVQPNGETKEQWFNRERNNFVDDQGNPRRFGGSGVTFDFRAADETSSVIIVVSDSLLRGQERMIVETTGQAIPVTLIETLLHELTHFRNHAKNDGILQTSDDDGNTYVDTALAALLTSTKPRPTVEVLLEFLEEISARHVEWHVRQELNGTPIAINLLTPEKFAAAVIEYLHHFPTVFDAGNGFIHTLNNQPDAVTLRLTQAALWLRRLQEFNFSDRSADETAIQKRLEEAADFCEEQTDHDVTSDPGDADGLYPLRKDFS
ncbi:MAG: peptidoglycan-binding domain-containing protein [Burkholderiales bacterium]